jgi:Carboxypeptidase regulatory-like domain
MVLHPRAVAVLVTWFASPGCGAPRHSTAANVSCPVPPSVSLADWVPTSVAGMIGGVILRVDSTSDSRRIPLPAAQIVAEGPLLRIATSDSAGKFQIAGLSGGRYIVTVRALGFLRRRDTLEVGAAAGVDGQIRLRSDVLPPCCHSRICL